MRNQCFEFSWVCFLTVLFWQACVTESTRCVVYDESALYSALANISCAEISIATIINVTENVLVNRPLTIFGETADAALVQINPNKNNLYIRDVTDGVHVFNLRISAIHAQAAVVVANASNVLIDSVEVEGSASIFAVFIAGRDIPAGIPTLENYESRTGMDTNNTFCNSLVTSQWDGDSLSFSLQYQGQLRNNTVVDGGKIAFYMNAECTCVDNTVLDSISQGIFLSSPSADNILVNNTILNAKYAAIKIKAQLEHADQGGTHDMSSQRDLIQDNVLQSRTYIGLEVNHVKCLGVYSNRIWRHKTMPGVYFQDVSNVTLWRNVVLVMNESVAGSVAGEVTTYPPSVSNIITLNATLEWELAVRGGSEDSGSGSSSSSGVEISLAPPCVPAPIGVDVGVSASPSALCTALNVSYGWKEDEE